MLLDDLEESTHKGYSGSTLPPKGAVGSIAPLEYCTVFDNARSGTTQLISLEDLSYQWSIRTNKTGSKSPI